MATNGKSPVTGLPLLRTALTGAYFERGDAIDAMLVAAVAGEHTILLGPPGTAKSALARAIAQGWGLKYWETLLTRFSTPEDVFGPVKLSALQADRYERATEAYFPACEIGFLDECFKANAGILNALLTALNERVYHNGGSPTSIPLVSCIGASNELPEGPELEALYDRFLVRLHVDYLADRGNFLGMLQASEPEIPRVSVDVRAEQATARAIAIAPDVFEAVADVRDACVKGGIKVSDRRWRKSLSLVRATAHVDGRTVASPDDLTVLENVLWREPNERSAVARLVQKTVNPSAAKAVECLDAAREARAKLPAETVGRGPFLSAAAECNQTLKEISARLIDLGAGKKVTAAKAEVTRIHNEVSLLAAKAAGLSFGGA